MRRQQWSGIMFAAALIGALVASGTADATMNNGGGPSKSSAAAKCLAQYHACYRHCDGWYKGDSDKINACKTRTCDYQYLNCVPQ
jgi:hypothetical protein